MDKVIEGTFELCTINDGAMFDALDARFGDFSRDEIQNIVAGDGVQRLERQERYAWWMVRFNFLELGSMRIQRLRHMG